MDQCSKDKVKLFRTLKVVFYCLGLPLFVFAVIITAATEYVGEFAYAGSANSELFASMKVLFNGTALYGLWVAAGVWLLIAIVHIITVATVKNRRARTLIVAAVTLVVMLVPIVAMDVAVPIYLEKLQSEAPEGIEYASYADEKGWFYTRTSGSWTPSGKYESNNYKFVTAVEDMLRTYNIGMYGGTKSGTATNTTNTPITYGTLFNDAAGEPYLTDVNDDKYDDLVKVAPNADGQLVIDGVVYTEYYCGATNQLWYRKGATAEMGDGVYGYASYNSNGLLSDGYVYGIDVALAILEQYYYSQEQMTAISNALTHAGQGASIPSYEQIIQGASEAREHYYTDGDASAYEKYIWSKETERAADFSLTSGELKTVLDALGGALGTNLSGLLKGLIAMLGGFGLGTYDEANCSLQIAVGTGYIELKAGPRLISGGDTPDDPSDDVYTEKEYLTIALPASLINSEDTSGKVYELGLDDRLLSGLGQLLDDLVAGGKLVRTTDENGNPTSYYTSVTQILEDVLGGTGTGTIGTIGTVVGLLGGLIGLDDILDLFEVEGAQTTEELLYGVIGNLLSALYWYASSEIKPLYDFYVEGLEYVGFDDASDQVKAYTEYQAMYDRAVYEGGMHGYVIGSVIVPGSSLIAGDTLGDGGVVADGFLFDSYASVVKFRTELAYKRWLYPLLGVRECLVCFMPFVLLFLILSGVAAEKEMLYATGQEKAKKSSKKDGKKSASADGDIPAPVKEEADDISAPVKEEVDNISAPEEGTETIVSDEYGKEVE